MKILAAAAGALALAMGATAPAAAVVSLASPLTCDIYTTGCLFNVDNGNTFSQFPDILSVYNAAFNPDLPSAVYQDKAEGGGFENSAGSYTDNGVSWTFASLPFQANIFLLKTQSDQVILFARDGSTPLTLTNTLIPNSSNPAEISHIDFFFADGFVPPNDVGVPEPATWAMMIMGFGAAGSIIRRRKMARAAA